MTSRRGRLALVVVPFVTAVVVLAYTYLVFPLRGVVAPIADDVMSAFKALIAISALGLSAWVAYRRAIKRPIAERLQRYAAGVFVGLAIFGYMGFGDIGYVRGYHRWEFFHYYLGAKYQHALRYDAIYAATAVAQAELSQPMRKEVEARSIRNLAIDKIVPAKLALDDAKAIKARFSSQQEWEAFTVDIAWFRQAAGDVKWWNDMQRDHGFNGSPVWMLVGQPLAKLAPASDLFMRVLASVDIFIFAALFGAIWWAFGWRTTTVAILFWGTQWPFDRGFTFGAFLRQDWILLLMLSACFAKKRWYVAAGVTLAWSTVLRLFPAVLFFPILVAGVMRFVRVKDFFHRDLRPFKRFIAGAAIATAVLGTAGVAVFGVDTTKQFVGRISSHSSAQSTNLMGLKSIVAFSWGSRTDRLRLQGAADDLAVWRDTRAEHVAERAPIYLAGALASVALCVASLRRRRAFWVLLPLGLPLVVGLSELSNYYYSVFLLLPLLVRFGARFELLTFATASFSALLIPWGRISNSYDSRCYFQSWVFLIATVVAVAALGLRRPRPKTDAQRTDVVPARDLA